MGKTSGTKCQRNDNILTTFKFQRAHSAPVSRRTRKNQGSLSCSSSVFLVFLAQGFSAPHIIPYFNAV